MRKFSIIILILVFVSFLLFVDVSAPLNNYRVYVIDTAGQPIEGANVKVYYSPLSDFPEGGSNSNVNVTTDSNGIATISLPNIILSSNLYCVQKPGYFNFRINAANSKTALENNPKITLKKKGDSFVVKYASQPFAFSQSQKLPSWNDIKNTPLKGGRNFPSSDGCGPLDSVDSLDTSYLATNSVSKLNNLSEFIVHKISNKEIEFEALGENDIYSFNTYVTEGYDIINNPIPLDGYQKKIVLTGYTNKDTKEVFYSYPYNKYYNNSFFIIRTTDGRMFGGTIRGLSNGQAKLVGVIVSSAGIEPAITP